MPPVNIISFGLYFTALQPITENPAIGNGLVFGAPFQELDSHSHRKASFFAGELKDCCLKIEKPSIF
jgi:hypothetical protein